MYNNTIVIDGLQYCKPSKEYFNLLKQSGITAIHVTLVYHENARETLTRFAEWNRCFEQYSNIIMPVMNMNDVKIAKRLNKVGIFFGAQNCSPIEDEIGLIEVMRKQGLLIMQLTYNNQSLLATGCYENEDNGITRFGKQTITEMNRVGMVIDMSHSANRSTLEAIDLSSRPICISHANPNFSHNSLRNKTDDVIKALIKRGGFFGFSLYPFHLPNKSKCTLDDFCNMIARTADITGINNIGIGSDLCLGQSRQVLEWMRNGRWSKTIDYGEGSVNNSGWPNPLEWFPNPTGMKNIYTGLLKNGFSETDVNKIIGKNWLYFLEQELQPMQ